MSTRDRLSRRRAARAAFVLVPLLGLVVAAIVFDPDGGAGTVTASTSLDAPDGLATAGSSRRPQGAPASLRDPAPERGSGEDPTQAYADLLARFSELGPDAPRRDEQCRLLTEFVRRHARAPANELLPVLKARVQLGLLHLHAYAPAAAREQFMAVVTALDAHALPSAARERIDLLGTALYALAQVEEISGDDVAATRILVRVRDELQATRYGVFAEAALSRLQRPRRAEAGRLAPSFARTDLSGKARDLASLRGKPVLLVFWSPEAEDGIAHVQRQLRAWQGMDPEAVITFAVGDEKALRAELEAHRLGSLAVVRLARDFLDEVALDYGVNALPTSFLIGPDGTLLGRNLSESRLREVLRSLAR